MDSLASCSLDVDHHRPSLDIAFGRDEGHFSVTIAAFVPLDNSGGPLT